MKYQTLWLGAAALALAACDNGGSTQSASNSQQTAAPEQSEQANQVETYTAEQFFLTTSFGMPSAAGYAFGAQSGDLLISSDESGVFNAYRVNTDTGERTALTAADGSGIFALSWFPEDERFLYTQDGGGDELNHVYVKTPDGTVTDVTPGEKLKASFVGWHESGESFYLISNERDASAFDVLRCSAEDYACTVLYENTLGLSVGAVSDDGRYVALTKANSSADSDIFVVDVSAQAAEPVLITQHEGNISYDSYGFTPDNTKLVYATNEYGEFAQAWTYDLATGDKAELIAADWDVSYVTYSPSGRYRVSGINADAETKVTILDTTTGEAVALKDLPEGSIGNVRFNGDESEIAFVIDGSTSPSNIHVASLATGEHKKLTEALNPAIASSDLVEAKVMRFASYDGLDIPGILYKPHQASADNPVPALVWVHGGPGGQSRTGYSATIQHLVNHGYAIYAINNRGSSGYGKTFFHMDDKKHGEADLGDVVASKAFLSGYEWVDGERIGIIGGSYGGYMVAAALAFEPEVFDVGVNIFGVTNWVRTLKSIPAWWGANRDALFDELGDPATDEERLQRISPLFHAENITRPLLVVQGANDPRVLQVESDELVAQVRKNDVPVEYVLFDDEGHGFRKRENRIEASEAYVSFLDQYLKGEAANTSGSR